MCCAVLHSSSSTARYIPRGSIVCLFVRDQYRIVIALPRKANLYMGYKRPQSGLFLLLSPRPNISHLPIKVWFLRQHPSTQLSRICIYNATDSATCMRREIDGFIWKKVSCMILQINPSNKTRIELRTRPDQE